MIFEGLKFCCCAVFFSFFYFSCLDRLPSELVHPINSMLDVGAQLNLQNVHGHITNPPQNFAEKIKNVHNIDSIFNPLALIAAFLL